MKGKAALSRGVPEPVIKILHSEKFEDDLIDGVIVTVYGVEDARDRPGEYYVQEPDFTLRRKGKAGAEFRLTGVNRDGRSTPMHYAAVDALGRIFRKSVQEGLRGTKVMVQTYWVIMLDKEIEWPPNSGQYNCNLEPPAVWVSDPEASGSELTGFHP